MNKSAVLTHANFVLSQLLDTKSTDRKMTLLHYIALVVKEKYPELATFYNELHFVDKAAAGLCPSGLEFELNMSPIYDINLFDLVLFCNITLIAFI